MDMPLQLRDAISNLASGYKQAQLKSAAQALTDRYKNESGQGRRLVTKNIETAAYAIVRMPATFGAVSSALEYTMDFYDGEISSVMDIGAGTGTASWAATSVLKNDLQFTCIEREPSMIEYGQKLAQIDRNLAKARWVRQDFSSNSITGKADLVVASYALNELDETNRKRVLQELWKATNKILLIVEPGTPVGFSQIRFAKDMLVEAGGNVVAPCTGNHTCPIPIDDWCHFTTRVSRGKLHKMLKDGDAPYEDEKFSFLAVSKMPTAHASKRILRHPIKEPGKITLQLCTQEGLKTQFVVKKDGAAFKKARKASCGDAFED